MFFCIFAERSAHKRSALVLKGIQEWAIIASAEVPFPNLIGNKKRWLLFKTFRNLQVERTYNDNNGRAHLYSGRFPVFIV